MMHFRIKKTGSMKKVVFFVSLFFISNRNSQLMMVWCTRVSADPRSVRFLFDGHTLDPEGTPESLEMEDNDEIDVMLSQVGGSEIGSL